MNYYEYIAKDKNGYYPLAIVKAISMAKVEKHVLSIYTDIKRIAKLEHIPKSSYGSEIKDITKEKEK